VISFGTVSRGSEAEHVERTAACGTTCSLKYVETPDVRVFRVSTAILYSTRWRTGNQWSWRSNGLASDRRGTTSTTRVALFCARCNFFRPYSRLWNSVQWRIAVVEWTVIQPRSDCPRYFMTNDCSRKVWKL